MADKEERASETGSKIEEARIAADKEEREAESQFQLEMKRLDIEAKRHEVKEVMIDDGGTANRRPSKLDVPKFEIKFLSNITKHLELFENVVKQNGYEESMWPLALRTAVVDTKLANIVAVGGAYQDLKKEILIAFGQRPEEIWNELINAEQAEKSFRQFCICIEFRYVLRRAHHRKNDWNPCEVHGAERMFRASDQEKESLPAQAKYLKKLQEHLTHRWEKEYVSQLYI